MANQDMHNNQAATQALDYQEITSDTNTDGDIIDTQGFEGCEFTLQGATITDGTFTLAVRQGDDSGLSDATTASGSEVLGSEAVTASNTVAQIGYVGNKRYVQLRVVSTATTSGGFVAGTAALGHPLHAPVS